MSRVKERDGILIQTIGPGDVLGWSWLFRLGTSSAPALAMILELTCTQHAPRAADKLLNKVWSNKA